MPSNIKYTGIDLSSASIRIASKKFNGVNRTFLSKEALNFYSNEKFDVVLLMHILSVSEAPDELLKKASHLLNQNGKLIVVNHFSNYPKWLNKLSVLIGFKPSFTFNEEIFTQFFNIALIESVNLRGKWKLIVLEHKKDTV